MPMEIYVHGTLAATVRESANMYLIPDVLENKGAWQAAILGSHGRVLWADLASRCCTQAWEESLRALARMCLERKRQAAVHSMGAFLQVCEDPSKPLRRRAFNRMALRLLDLPPDMMADMLEHYRRPDGTRIATLEVIRDLHVEAIQADLQNLEMKGQLREIHFVRA